MDRIQAALRTSRYIDEPHLVMLVYGEPLDEVIASALLAGPGSSEWRFHGYNALRGLVTTLDKSLIDEADRQLAWERILPVTGETTKAPILVCPDDLDFDCTTVVVEVLRLPATVTWSRFGFDRSPWGEVGTEVRWLASVAGFEFSIENYEAFLSQARHLAQEWWGKPEA